MALERIFYNILHVKSAVMRRGRRGMRKERSESGCGKFDSQIAASWFFSPINALETVSDAANINVGE